MVVLEEVVSSRLVTKTKRRMPRDKTRTLNPKSRQAKMKTMISKKASLGPDRT